MPSIDAGFVFVNVHGNDPRVCCWGNASDPHWYCRVAKGGLKRGDYPKLWDKYRRPSHVKIPNSMGVGTGNPSFLSIQAPLPSGDTNGNWEFPPSHPLFTIFRPLAQQVYDSGVHMCMYSCILFRPIDHHPLCFQAHVFAATFVLSKNFSSYGLSHLFCEINIEFIVRNRSSDFPSEYTVISHKEFSLH